MEFATGGPVPARQPTTFTVAICAFNAVGRIGRTLDALTNVRYWGHWEVLVVDNASTDGTSEFVQAWGQALPGMRVVREPVAGVAHARVRAIREASCDWIVWVDDDNLLPPDYLDTAHAIVADRDDAGVVAGDSKLFKLAVPPAWFDKVAGCYAVGRQMMREGDQHDGAFCWGAGSMLRRRAATRILDLGFRPVLTGRLGRHQLAGEDAEICLATRLLGWSFLYSRKLVIGHAIDPQRMTVESLRRTAFGFGLSSIALEVYRAHFDPPLKRWVKTRDLPFFAYSLAKLGSRWLRWLFRRDMRACADLWASQGAAAALISGMRPSSVLATPFLEALRAEKIAAAKALQA
jgi:glycosyltransferase involved in cell wall biosynthesis